MTFELEGKPQLAQNQPYAARLTASGPIAAIANLYGRGAVSPQMYAYDTLANSATPSPNVAYAPVIMSNYASSSYNTSLVIQNLGSTTANVTITYSNGTVKTATIAPGGVSSRYTPSDIPTPTTLTGAKVVADQPIGVIVNESTSKNRAASYEGLRGGTATVVRAPIVMRRFARNNTSVQCQNVGMAPTRIQIAYSGVPTVFTSLTVPAGGTYLFYQGKDPLLADGYIGSATLTAVDGQPIVCVVNEDMDELPDRDLVKDMLYAYDAVGQ